MTNRDQPDPTAAYVAALAAAAAHGPRWPQGLGALIDDDGTPAEVRAAAVAALARAHPRHLLARFMDLIEDPDPRVRLATVEASRILVPEDRVKVAGPALSDPVRDVRLAAGRALVGAEEELSAELAPLFVTVRNEWMERQSHELDSAESWARLAGLHAALGRGDDAERSLRRALDLDPHRVEAWTDLVELNEALGRPEEAAQALADALALHPHAPGLIHARGLAHVRSGRPDAALVDLARAVDLAPDSPRFAYVYAVALMDLRGPTEALAALDVALGRHPREPALLRLAVELHGQVGNPAAALAAARTLEESDPGDPTYQALVLEFIREGRAKPPDP